MSQNFLSRLKVKIKPLDVTAAAELVAIRRESVSRDAAWTRRAKIESC